MGDFIYTVCPVCRHPNVHVEDGRIVGHTHGLSCVRCAGTGRAATENRTEPLSRNTPEYEEALRKAWGVQETPEARCCICSIGLRHVAIPNRDEICPACKESAHQRRLDHDRRGL